MVESFDQISEEETESEFSYQENMTQITETPIKQLNKTSSYASFGAQTKAKDTNNSKTKSKNDSSKQSVS